MDANTRTLETSNCVDSFKAAIRGIASEHGKDPESVYQWWREYCQQCQWYDQSPFLAEFRQWNFAKLTDGEPALTSE